MNLEIDSFDVDGQFASLIYKRYRPDFISSVKPVFDEYVEAGKGRGNDVYPAIMTDAFSGDNRLEDFVKYVSGIAWDILNNQGYNMDLFYTDASDMWGQHHPYTSNMENHIHGEGSQLVGMYFIDVPDDSSELCLYDPRPAKVYADLPLRESSSLQPGHSSVFYKPQAGDLYFTNAWLAHSFTRNRSKQPLNFVHINIRVVPRHLVDKQECPIIV